MQIPNWAARFLTLSTLIALSAPAHAGFRFVDGDGFRDLYFNDRPLYRYVTPTYDPKNRDATLKPFLHIYGFHEEGFITKGAGGMETHHRGIFFGFVTQVGNFWACNDGHQEHVRYLPERERVDDKSARMASVVEWVAKDGKAVARDTREVSARLVEDRLFLDFDIKLESLVPELELKGDAHHGGFHFRAAEEVQGPATTKPSIRAGRASYFRPGGTKLVKDDIWAETPWGACLFAIQNHPYIVVLMNNPHNAERILFSMRPYGRFGVYFTEKLRQGKPVHVQYRIVIIDGRAADDLLEGMYWDYSD